MVILSITSPILLKLTPCPVSNAAMKPSLGLWKECIQRVTVEGLYLSHIYADNTSVYQQYMEELSSIHPAYIRYAHVLKGRTEDDWMLPVGRLVVLNHWGVLQVCLLQCAAFRAPESGIP